MPDAPNHGSGRLDSWKAIAAYLQRDESTVRRWEHDLGLPVRRILDGRGASVFAYVSEIDAWLKTRPSSSPAKTRLSASDEPRRTAVPASRWRLGAAVAALAVVAVVIDWRMVQPSASDAGLTIKVERTAFAAMDAAGHERWRYTFPGERIETPPIHPSLIVTGSKPEIVAAASWRVSLAGDTVKSGQVLSFTTRGRLAHTFAFDDHLTFDATVYEQPWGITDVGVEDGRSGRRIAVATHHYQWWPSMVTILDDQWRRQGTFVNAGWIERLNWLSTDRLLITGFSEAFDGGMAALLDTHALDGQSPASPNTRFFCTTCGTNRPLRYVVMPRSEVNRATGSRFNRAVADIDSAHVIIRTVEASTSDADVIDAVYEFTLSLDPIKASYSDRYWDLHRALEARGVLHHTREECPERDGPQELQVWEPQTGWRAVALR